MTTIYHGYTETDYQILARWNRWKLADIEATYGANWEQDADALRTHIEAADLLDWIGEAEALAAEDADHRATTGDIMAGL